MCVKVTPGEEVTAKIGTVIERGEVVGIVIVMVATVGIRIVLEVDGIVVIKTREIAEVVTKTVVAEERGTAEADVMSAEAVMIETVVVVVIVVIVIAAVKTQPHNSVVMSYKITVKYVLALIGKTFRESISWCVSRYS